MLYSEIQKVDPEVYESLKNELQRQRNSLEMIASENFTSPAVMEAQGSIMTNKYAEGLPGKRYYGGCEFHDQVEQLAIDRAKALFKADHANVQPHSGSNANFAAYFSVLEAGDKILGPLLPHGGHLTHGSPANFSGRLFKFSQYTLNQDTQRFEPDDILEIARREKPKLILTGYSAYPRKIEFEKWRAVADEVGAVLMADIAHIAGLIAAEQHPQPFPHCDIVTTTTHKTLRGPRGGIVMCTEKYAKQVDKTVFPGFQGGPLMHAIAGKAIALKEAQSAEFRKYAEQVVKNAHALADELMSNGFNLVTGGTDSHLMLVNLESKSITGKEAKVLLEQVGITANKNMVPDDKQSPFVTSGIRLGTPAITSRGMKEDQMRQIGELISRTMNYRNDEEQKRKIKNEVLEICKAFPLYPDF